MRLGMNIPATGSPEEWIAELKKHGCRAAYCPLDETAPDALIAEYRQAAAENDIIIAEVGIWNNMLTPDAQNRARNIELSIKRLILADKIGARCCVNVSGNPTDDAAWDRYFEGYDSDETYALIARTVRHIIDQAQPRTARFSIECMQWMIPDSIESYERLIREVDSEHFGVHFDPVNLIYSPWRYAHNGEYVREFIRRLGAKICSCHAKDVILRPENMLVHIEETLAGTGRLNYAAFLSGINELDPEIPVMLEHLPTAEQYEAAAGYVRAQAHALGLGM